MIKVFTTFIEAVDAESALERYLTVSHGVLFVRSDCLLVPSSSQLIVDRLCIPKSVKCHDLYCNDLIKVCRNWMFEAMMRAWVLLWVLWRRLHMLAKLWLLKRLCMRELLLSVSVLMLIIQVAAGVCSGVGASKFVLIARVGVFVYG